MYISNNGVEGSPKINFACNSNQWYDLRTVVDGVSVKIFIDNALIQQVTITGDGSISGIDNYVGLWNHRLAHVQGKDFHIIQGQFMPVGDCTPPPRNPPPIHPPSLQRSATASNRPTFVYKCYLISSFKKQNTRTLSLCIPIRVLFLFYDSIWKTPINQANKFNISHHTFLSFLGL